MQVNSCSDNELTTVGSDDFHELGWVGLRFDERVCCRTKRYSCHQVNWNCYGTLTLDCCESSFVIIIVSDIFTYHNIIVHARVGVGYLLLVDLNC